MQVEDANMCELGEFKDDRKVKEEKESGSWTVCRGEEEANWMN